MNTLPLKTVFVPAACAALFLTASVSLAHGQFVLPDDTASYAMIFEGQGNNQLTLNTSVPNQFGTSYTVNGNIGLGDLNSGTPSFADNNVVVDGAVNFAGAISNSGGGGTNTITGGQHANVAQVETDVLALNSLSTTLAGYSGTNLAINTGGSGGSQTINASSGNLVSGNEVFNITGLQFNSNTTLYINGSGSAPVVLNVALGSNANFDGSIVLEGGLTANQVIFNLTNSTGLQISAGDATQNVTYLDPTGHINADAVDINGHIFGGDDSNLQYVSNAVISAPFATPEPGAWALAVVALLGMAVLRTFRGSKRI